MAAQPRKAEKSASGQKEVWTEPRLQRIDFTPELVELFRRIQAGEGSNRIEPLKRRIAATRKQGADLA